MPSLTVLAGPDGSGKSSTTSQLVIEGRENLLDPDAIAKRIDPENPARAGVKAGKEVIHRIRQYIEMNQSFAIETTLAGSGHLETMRAARERGFIVNLAYVCLRDSDLNVQRVRARFAGGGHDVPDADIKRRYERSLANVPAAVKLAHSAWLYDNSGTRSRMVLEARDGAVIWCADDAPEWLMQVRERLFS